MEHKPQHIFLFFLSSVFVPFLLLVSPASSHSHTNSAAESGGKHFVLVHGAAHGAWTWYKLAPLLKSAGHKVTTFDLAASGIDSRNVLDVPLISQFFEPILEFMASVPENQKVILVAHSFSGLGISLAMEKFPEKIAAAVFVVALMPGPRTNFTLFWEQTTKTQGDTMDTYLTHDNGLDNPPTTIVLGKKYLAKKVYQRSSTQDLTLGRSLVRPFHVYGVDDISRTIKLTEKRYGSVKRVFIEAGEDEVLQLDFQRWMIEQNPPNEAKLVKRSDHMVMLCQPSQLYLHVLRTALKYA